MSERPPETLLKPVLPGSAPSDYERYLRTPELLSLQKTREEMGHRDELLFQTVHQTSELWLKHACYELEDATAGIRAGELGGALRLCRRAILGIRIVMQALPMLEQLDPWEYQEVRRYLGHGSGFDSPGFNRVREVSPLLWDAFADALSGAGLDLVTLYQRSRQHEALYQLAESLCEWDELICLWRVHHLKTVQRVIGAGAIGTQGTPVEVMGKLTRERLFPQLWEVRNTLTELAQVTGVVGNDSG
jgi:tryptophan 2,3-dioxygenase